MAVMKPRHAAALALVVWYLMRPPLPHIDTHAVRDLGLRDAKDPVIFKAARDAGVVIMSKDEDFRLLVERLGPPPQVL